MAKAMQELKRSHNGLIDADPAELDLLFQALPPHINRAVKRLDHQGLLLEVVLDLGREPEARFPDHEVILDETPVTSEDLEFVSSRVGSFGDDNRAGIERTLHRISVIRNRGVQLVATAHGNSLENLLVNPTLNDLLGGIQTVTLSDEEARRRGTQKSVLERKSPPTFDVLVEIHDRDRLAIHQPLAEVVDAALRGTLKPPQMRIRGADGAIVARIAETAPMRTAAVREPLEAPRSRGLHETVSVFPYGVSRNYLEQAITELKVPIRIQNHIEEADLIVTLKNYYRRKDSPLKEAEADGIPIQVLKSNTITQIKNALSRVYQLDTPDPTESALQETLEGISRAKSTNSMVELSPQNAYVRRLQHQLVERHELTARSTGKEPNRRLRIYTTAD